MLLSASFVLGRHTSFVEAPVPREAFAALNCALKSDMP